MRMVARRRPGFRSLCAAIDLLGMRRMLLDRPHEAAARLNDLQKLPEALLLFPGGEKYRACFVGDSWFIVREVPPEEDWTQQWPHFCGHVFALASFMYELEGGLGNPGLRAVTAHGEVSQVFEPDEPLHPELRAQLKHWFVLTGADQALVKCDEALRAGQRLARLQAPDVLARKARPRVRVLGHATLAGAPVGVRYARAV